MKLRKSRFSHHEIPSMNYDHPRLKINVRFRDEDTALQAEVDTTSPVCLLPIEVLPPTVKLGELRKIPENLRLRSGTGHSFQAVGIYTTWMLMGGEEFALNWVVSKNCNFSDPLIRLDFYYHMTLTHDWENACFIAKRPWLGAEVPNVKIPIVNQACLLRTVGEITINSGEGRYVECSAPLDATHWTIEKVPAISRALAVARIVEKANNQGHINAFIANYDSEDITIAPNATVAQGTPNDKLKSAEPLRTPKRWYDDYNKFINRIRVLNYATRQDIGDV